MKRSQENIQIVLWIVTATGLCLGSANEAAADSGVYQRVIQSTGLVEVMQPGHPVGWGTCWIVNKEHKLVMTCAHVLGEADEALVYFPAANKDGLIHEYAAYRRHVAPIRCRVILREAERDLALLRLESLPDGMKELPLADVTPAPGATVHSIGNSGIGDGELWRYTSSTVRVVHRMRKSGENPSSISVVKTQAPINPGDSGGPLVNDASELVGVVMAVERDTRLVALNVDVREVKEFLKAGHEALEKFISEDATTSAPTIHGSWKVVHVNVDGDHIEGSCRFMADGSFEMRFSESAKRRELRGKFSRVNGVIHLATANFDLRTPLHWARKDRFTMFSEGMLIFDRVMEVAENAADGR